MKLPTFSLYGQNNSKIEANLRPSLSLRGWSGLSAGEKQIAFQELENNGWLKSYSKEALQTIEYLNHEFLRLCPGKHLHAIIPERDYHGYGNESKRIEAALTDFQHIFLREESEVMVLRMLSYFAECYIDKSYYRLATESTEEKARKDYIERTFNDFDRLANCLNHIFEQFAVNQLVTRSGFVPRQDQRITDEIYTPTLMVLSDPKWKNVSSDLSEMFDDYRNEDFPEVITKAHRAVQRFLQILVGEEGKNGTGEMSKLFKQAKDQGIIPTDRFTEPVMNAIQSFIPSERAKNSTAKPALKEASASDALLMMNVVMILIQHCLQKQN